ncbi:pyrimidine 5'-nucleotidase [Nitratireductor aestuarii]|uniref:Pyrimidine 5'-nucleotidase n=1 Tax=Nitratireductor aestuarii TaxID=1735103 RepID=A0A916W7K8_9HYPH|nr:pyrimidine 5'-nucleotidase [Nitratireductor aestuarii]GGA74340.1 pyrimidine 5'-nucleotidase [Nitratireductor aestuarii]
MNKPDPTEFEHVRSWVFDLDNTLYPHDADLFSQIDVLMTTYVSEFLRLSREDARKLQKDLYRDHGTTLRGLMDLYNVDPDDFLQKVHDIDYSWLKPNPALGEAIRSLPGRKFIFTNGNRSHAEKAAAQLGILDQFEDIFDIVAAGLIPKPAKESYEAFVALHGIAGPDAVMFEDLARNLAIPKQLGMKTVLIVPQNLEETYSEVWERDLGREDEVDYVTDDLTLFLQTINSR